LADALPSADRAQAEITGPRYDRLMMIETRNRTFEAIRRIGAGIRPGMTENEGEQVARTVLREGGLLRGWHGIKLRFGANTTLTFCQASEPGVVLGEDDIFFVDIGPVWRNCEGDGGETFTTGSDPEMNRIARDSKSIFDAVAARWRADGLTGRALYDFAVAEAEARGWLLNLDLSGHRVSDFPHAAQFDGALIDQNFVPSPDLWILEIQLRHPTRPFGAFYEDLLTDA
jgi:Xaa-Pro aminopeptidase